MSTTVTYKGSTLTTATNQTKVLETAGKYMEGDVTITDVTTTYTDGDNLEYGSAGLIGTTWYFNSSLDFSGVGSADSYNINFTSNSTDYNLLQLTNLSGIMSGVLYNNSNTDTTTYAYMIGAMGNGWYNQAYRTITFTGGLDATNQNLIDWVTANATQQ